VSDTACIILAGGRSTRMGTNKALLAHPGNPQMTFVEYLVSILTPFCPETFLVARDAHDAAKYVLPGVQVITDKVPGGGPLMGLYSGLCVMRAQRALLVAVDMPYIQPELISFLLAQPLSEALIVPFVNNAPQVLLALYPRSVLPLIERCIEQGYRGPRFLLDVAPVQYIDEAQLRLIDADLRSFVNVNTPEDWKGLG
jgi:molybdopterin-guanine dinucleotide biosynthesis protein A